MTAGHESTRGGKRGRSDGGAASDPPVLEAVDVVRRYGPVVALGGVSLAVSSGEAVGLLGDNGAGKSTLVEILTGVESPTAGEVRIDGAPVRLASPAEARALGIAVVHQDLGLVPLLSAWRNFFLGAEPVKGRAPFRRIDRGRCRRTVEEEMARLGIERPDAERAVATLSGGERQALAIARALHFGARVLLLDEPTAALGVRPARIVLEQVERAKREGAAVVLVTHNPRHAWPACDRFVVLRRGRVAAEGGKPDVDIETLEAWMASEEVA